MDTQVDKSCFSARLVELLKKHKVTTAALSKAINIAEITINKLRTGQNVNPTVSTVIAIANYFNVSVDYLVNSANMKTMPVMDIDKFNDVAGELNSSVYAIEADFAIRITDDNYPEYKKHSLLFISKNANFINGDVVLVRLDNAYAILKIIIEGNAYTGKSLTGSARYYDIASRENILGTVVGVIWKRAELLI